LRRNGQNSRRNQETRVRQKSQRKESGSRTEEITELAKSQREREIHVREKK
jgi:hypothetical protein